MAKSPSFVLFQALFAWLYIFLIKREPLFGKILMEIESAVGKQTKRVIFQLFSNYFQNNDIEEQPLLVASEKIEIV